MLTARFGATGVFFLAVGLLAGTLGCGSGDNASENATNLSTDANNLPTTAIPGAPGNKSEVLPEKGTPEWYLHEITVERLKSPPSHRIVPVEQPASAAAKRLAEEINSGLSTVKQVMEETGKSLEELALRVETVGIDEIRDFQRAQNYKIVELAKNVISKTYDDPQKVDLFETAVHHAMEAQLQLAIQVNGVSAEEHQQNENDLVENAELVHEFNPQSKAANIAAFTLVKYAEIMARKLADQDPALLENYAQMARLFALNFPKDEARAIAKLDAAGWSCEAYGRLDLATACYAQIEKQFPKNPLAQHVPAVLRRLSLAGEELKLAGPTHDGGFLSVDTLRNKVVLVAFWAADTEGFELDAGILKEIYGKYAAAGVEIVGVNLDENEAQMQAFLKQHGFTWPNIFYIDQTKRRWNNPVVRYYGVREIPTYWLVDQKGVVVDTQVKLQTAEQQIQKLLEK
jgi:peroxiredoxin